jgi:glycosyltransferase involved in cell wall biosynthesis
LHRPAPGKEAALSELLVVIPALDEEATVGDVVRGARDQIGGHVLVVDDGSGDATATVARTAGATVISHPFNLGVGAAVRSGLRYASEHGYTTVVQLDGDGQHDPSDGRRLVERLHDESADIVVGSRFARGYRARGVRRLGMRALSKVVSARLGTPLTDTTSGYRAFGKRAVDRLCRAYPSVYLSDTVEVLLMAGDWGLRVVEEPVRMRARQGGRPSSGAALSTVSFLRLALVILLHDIRRPLPARGGS